MISRRSLVQGGAATIAGALVSRPLLGTSVERFQELPVPQDARLKELIETAVDAAMGAGASYADARLTFTQQMGINGSSRATSDQGIPHRAEDLYFGVRAMYGGYWGFAASPVWNRVEAARLGQRVVADAKANMLGKERDSWLAPSAGPKTGNWNMPVKDDPFEMDPQEIADYLSGLVSYILGLPGDEPHLAKTQQVAVLSSFERQQKAFGSSEGQFFTQRLYRTTAGVSFMVGDPPWEGGRSAGGSLPQLSVAGAGFEYIRHSNIREWVRKLYEDLVEERFLPIVPVDVGRHLSLVHPNLVAQAVGKTIGVATEVDRVMGFEANAGGTSYIMEPEEMLGKLKIGAPVMQVTGSRSSPGGVGHVKWDDEGVEPKDFQLIKDGVLANLQTSREGVGMIQYHYKRNNQEPESFGCASAPDASYAPVVHPADLILHPDRVTNSSIDDLRQQIDKGIEWKAGTISMDFQQSTGLMMGYAFQIKNGKRTARIASSGMLFRTSELWGNIQQLGGEQSISRVGIQYLKGEPLQVSYGSVDAPAVLFKDMAVINPAEKA